MLSTEKNLQNLQNLLPPIHASLFGWSFIVSSQLKGNWLQSTNRMKTISARRLEKTDDEFSELKSIGINSCKVNTNTATENSY